MKHLSLIVFLGVMGLTSLLVGCGQNQDTVTFSCEQNSDKEWTTFAKNGQQTSELILWQRTDFVKVGFPPEKRCQEVTPRLQEAYDNGSLPSLTHGEMPDEKGTKQKVLCTDDENKTACKTLILTLLSTDDPDTNLKQFSAVLNGDANGAYKNSSCENIDGRLHCTVDINNVFNKKK